MKLLYGMMRKRLDVVIIREMLDEVKEYRSILIEAVLIMMKICWKFMEDENSITEEEINKALRAVMDMAIIPMIAGSSLKNKGVQFMLDAVNILLQWIKIVLKDSS
jgi:elongation factor G